MKTRTWLPLTVILALSACTPPSAPQPPTTPEPPSAIVTTFHSKAELQAFAANLYGEDDAQRDRQIAAYIQATQAQANSASGLRAASLPDHIQSLLTVDEQELLNMQRGMKHASGLTLDGWAKQASAFGFRSADGGELTADVIRSKLQALAAQDTFTPQQRPLAIVAALSAARSEGSSATFGDDTLDAVQVLIMNNVLMARLLDAEASGALAAAHLQAAEDDGGLKLFHDVYNTGKELLSDIGTVLTGVKEFGEFGECSAFLVSSIVMTLEADRTAIWRQGLDGPFQAQLTAKAELLDQIKDEDLTYYAKNGCAPTANRTFENVQTRWMLSSVKNGTLSLNQGPTDAQGKVVNTFTAVADTSRAADRFPENKRTDAVTARVMVSQLSAKYPHLEVRMLDAQRENAPNLGRSLKLNVSYYEPTTVQWRLNFKTVKRFPGPYPGSWNGRDPWYETSTGEVLFELDRDRSTDTLQYLRPVDGSFSTSRRGTICAVNWPEVVNQPVVPLMDLSALQFMKTDDPNVMQYSVGLGTLDMTMVDVSYRCADDTMTYRSQELKVPILVARIGDHYTHDFPSFNPTQGINQLSGTYAYELGHEYTTTYTLTRVGK